MKKILLLLLTFFGTYGLTQAQSSLNFDGNNDYVLVNQPGTSLNSLALGNFTIEAWVYPTSNAGVKSIIRKGGDYNVYLNGGVLTAELWVAGMGTPNVGVLNGSTVLPTNTWSHVAITWNSTTISANLYVNGVAETVTPGNFTLMTSEPLWIGMSSIYAQPFAGSIDELRFWNSEKTVTEIMKTMNCPVSNSAAGLLAYYNFNEGVADGDNTALTTVFDQSPNSNNAALINFALNGTASNFVANATLSSMPSVTAVASSMNICSGVTDTLVATATGGTGTYTTYSWAPGTHANDDTAYFSSTNPGLKNWRVVVIDDNGCASLQDTAKVLVKALPPVTITPSAATICATDAVTLTTEEFTSTTGTLCGTANEGGQVVITAPIGATITSVLFASYGTPQGSCGSFTADPLCNAFTSVTVVGNLCIGQNACVIDADNNTFGDPCSGTGKMLAVEVEYTMNAVSLWSTNETVPEISVSPSSTTTYTVTRTGENGCVNTASATVTVNDLPTVTATSDATNDAVCEGSDITLTGGGADSYVWDNSVTDNTAFALTDTMTYTVIGTDVNGCENIASIIVYTLPLPTVTASSDATNDAVCEGSDITLMGDGADTYVWDNGVTDNVAFALNDTAIHMVTGTDANGCSDMAMITVYTLALPVVSNLTGDVEVCGDASHDFEVTNNVNYTYEWNYSDDLLNWVLIDGSYGESNFNTNLMTIDSLETNGWDDYYLAAEVTGSNGCTAISDASYVTVNELPTVTASSDAVNDVVCTGNPVTLMGGGAVSYVWDNSVTDNVAFTPADTTTYTVTGEDANGCTNTATITVYVDLCTGLANKGAANLSVYPNPTTGNVTITTSGTVANSIEVFDVVGNFVANVLVTNETTNINLSTYADGVYVVKVRSNNTTQNIRIVKAN